MYKKLKTIEPKPSDIIISEASGENENELVVLKYDQNMFWWVVSFLI